MFFRKILFTFTVIISLPLNAQIIRDGTVGPDQSIQPELVDDFYYLPEEMGERSGNNLFHSFEQFNILEGQQAFFDGDASIANVITRVTGDSVSQINGGLGSGIDGASFFLINPNGVVFGAGAAISVQGSFNVSTGTMEFSDGEVFGASVGGAGPILSSAVPSSFGFLGESENTSIDVRGVALWLESDFILNATNINLLDGRLLSGLGYDITLEAQNDITISGTEARIYTITLGEGEGVGGTVDIHARNVHVIDGGSISALSYGTGLAGEINVIAEEDIRLSGVRSTINSFNYSPVTGANINLQANLIDVGTNGRENRIESQSQGGQAGNISLVAQDRIIGAGPGDSLSFIASQALAWGEGGNLELNAPTIELSGGFEVLSLNLGSAGGALDIVADNMSVTSAAIVRTTTGPDAWGQGGELSIDVSDQFTISGIDTTISTVSLGPGPSGDVRVNAGSIDIINSAELFSYSSGDGGGGSIYLTADDYISLDMQPGAGELDVLNPRVISFADGAGDGGDISLVAPTINVREGSAIKTSARNTGQGGDILLQAEDTITVQGLTQSDHGIDVANLAELGIGTNAGTLRYSAPGLSFDGSQYRRSTAVAPGDQVNANPDATGSGGDIVIQADNIEFTDGAYVESNTDTSGAGGSITLDAANAVNFSGVNFLGDSSLLRTATDYVSTAGDISVASQNISLTDGAVLLSENLPNAEGATGNISLVAEARITIAGGNPNYLAAPPSLQTVSQNANDSGRIDISAEAIELQDARLNTETQSGEGGNISIHSDHMYLDNSTVTTSVTGNGDGGDIAVTAKSLVLNHGSAIIAQADMGNGGAIDLNVNAFAKSANSLVDASSNEGIDGVVSVKPGAEEHQAEAPIEAKYIDASSLIRASCSNTSQQNSLTLFHTAGALISPEGPLPLGNHLHALSSMPEFSPLASGENDALTLASLNASHTASKQQNAIHLLENMGNQAFRNGKYRSAVGSLVASAKLAEEKGDELGSAQSMADLGNTLVAVGKNDAAEQILLSALLKAQAIGDAELVASVLNNLGNFYVARGANRKAVSSYTQGVESAEAAGNSRLLATILANVARAALNTKGVEQVLPWLDRVEGLLGSIAANEDKTNLHINVAKTYELLGEQNTEQEGQFILSAYTHLREAEKLSRASENPRLTSYAVGNLALLYQSEGRFNDALVLARGAIASAEKSGVAESLYRWFWLEAKLLWQLGDADNAIRSYRRALAIVESTKQSSIARYESSISFFKRLVEPVYLDAVDALILTAANRGGGNEGQKLLQEARQVVEQLKTAELENYYQDECLVKFNAKRKKLDEISSSAAIIYPIVMPDRLELLVSLPVGESRQLNRYKVDVAGQTLNMMLKRFRQHLENYSDLRVVNSQAQQLYRYLVAPYATALSDSGVDTLVFVPDGTLRSAPLSALHDGDGYLLHKYAVAVTSSLVLSDPRPIGEKEHSLLLAGVSQPVNGLSALEQVPGELAAIQKLFGGDVLLDEDFTAQTFSENIRNNDVSIVHIASHAKFTGDYQSSFLQTFDQPLYSDELNFVLASTKYRDQPLELLVLSACQTAAGNDQAALGLAGIGIKAGAQSAMGSLWNISDAAASELVQEFYRQLKGGNVSKAEALRQAQMALLERSEYTHPFFWSPFVLIDNWL